ncbi:hypothetical protein N7535_001486 [Penicillium sp. DV-2018c]|nr:hypothetical protein N7461_005269 [Penicillium sp. DV-2018c]KAJ5582866.1 hypothetical protein N7535_001486 [Penicillium sp. DV-2018c]
MEFKGVNSKVQGLVLRSITQPQRPSTVGYSDTCCQRNYQHETNRYGENDEPHVLKICTSLEDIWRRGGSRDAS